MPVSDPKDKDWYGMIVTEYEQPDGSINKVVSIHKNAGDRDGYEKYKKRSIEYQRKRNAKTKKQKLPPQKTTGTKVENYLNDQGFLEK